MPSKQAQVLVAQRRGKAFEAEREPRERGAQVVRDGGDHLPRLLRRPLSAHFEVYRSLAAATSYQNRVLTSQMALPRSICSAAYAGASGYTSSATHLSRVQLATETTPRRRWPRRRR